MAGLGILVGGSNVGQYVQQSSVRVEYAQGQRAIAFFEMVSANGTYRPQLGQTVGIFLGDNIFGGTIDQIEETSTGNGAGRTFQVSCVSWEQRYDKRFITKTYQSTNCGAIFADLIALTGEINNSAPNIQNGATVDLLVLDAAQVSAVFSDLATRSGYIWGITADQSAFFVPRATYEAPGALGSESILKGAQGQWAPTIRTTREQLQNVEWRRIARTAVNPEVESFTGDGSNQTFNTDHDIALIPENGIKVNGTPVDFGPNTDTEIAWRVTYGTTLITQREDGTPLTSSDTLEVTYYRVGGDLVEYTDHAAVGAQQTVEGGGSGRYEKFVDDASNTDAGSALAAATADVNAFKVAPVEITVYTRLTGYLPGQIVGIALPAPHSAYTGEYLVNQVTLQHEAGDGSGTDDFCLFELKAISTTYLGGYRQFFRDLTGTGGGAPISATISGSGGTGSPSAPSDATITAIDILGYHTDGPEGGTQHRSRRDATYVRLGLRGAIPAGAKGVWILGEEPDTSGSAYTRGVAGEFVAGSGVIASGALQPRDYGRHDYDASSPYLAIWSVRAPVETAAYRYYAVTYGDQIENTFVPANQDGASPSLTVSISPEPDYTSGEEYAPNALNLTCEAAYQLDNNVWSYWLNFTWTEPTNDPRWDRLTGYTIHYQYEDGGYNYQEVERGETDYSSDVWPVSDGSSTIVVWLRSKGIGGINRIVKGVTPSATVVVQRPTDTAGQEYAPLVTGVYASIVKSQTQDGVEVYNFEHGIGLDQDGRIGQFHVFAHETTGDTWHDIGTFSVDDPGPHTTDKWPVSNSSANFTLYFYSISRDGKENTHSDTITPKVTGLSLTASATGTVKATRLTLFKNTEFEVVGGEFRVKNVDFTKAMPGTFDSLTFDISGGLWKIANSGIKETHINAGAVTTLKLTTNAIDVGGGGGKPIQFRVFNSFGALTGWIGHDTGSGFDGAWFKRCFIGGTSPADAKIIADAAGNVAISGSLIVGAVAQATSAGSANTANSAAALTGTISCSQLVAGTMTSTGPTAGLTIAFGGETGYLSPREVLLQSGSTTNLIRANFIAIIDSFSGPLFNVNSAGILNCKGYQVNGSGGLTTTVFYRKSDGISNGTLTFTAGLLTGQS